MDKPADCQEELAKLEDEEVDPGPSNGGKTGSTVREPTPTTGSGSGSSKRGHHDVEPDKSPFSGGPPGSRSRGGTGTKVDPVNCDDESGISDDDPQDDVPKLDEDIEYGSAYEKTEEYDRYLNDPNPWHEDLSRPLFPSQVISFRWMCDRHLKGGGIVADKVGTGKVKPPLLYSL